MVSLIESSEAVCSTTVCKVNCVLFAPIDPPKTYAINLTTGEETAKTLVLDKGLACTASIHIDVHTRKGRRLALLGEVDKFSFREANERKTPTLLSSTSGVFFER